jgi:hypothetical protein
MGEFLLSILTMQDNILVYSRKLPFSHFKNGTSVTLYNPHAGNPNACLYYRVYDKPYKQSQLLELVATQNPNVIDEDDLVPYQRQLRDADIYELIQIGYSFSSIGQKYGWHKEAVREAVRRHQEYTAKRNNDTEAERTPMDTLVADNDHIDNPVPSLTPEQKEHILSVWSD